MTEPDDTLQRYDAMKPFEWLEGHLGFIDNHVEGELEQAIFAMATILTFLQNSGIKSLALSRLHIQLFELSEGSHPGAMLAKRTKAKRPSDPTSVEIAKGGLAGIMEIKMRSGMQAKEAAQWVIDHTSNQTKKKLGDATKITAHTIGKWRERFGGDHASPGMGSTNFQRIVRAWQSHKDAGQRDQADHLLRAIQNSLMPVVTRRS